MKSKRGGDHYRIMSYYCRYVCFLRAKKNKKPTPFLAQLTVLCGSKTMLNSDEEKTKLIKSIQKLIKIRNKIKLK